MDRAIPIRFATRVSAVVSCQLNQTPRSAGVETEICDYLVAATIISDLEGSTATRVSSLFSIPSIRASRRAT